MDTAIELVLRSELTEAMRRFDVGLDVPGTKLELTEFLSESATYFSELFLAEALIHTTDPFDDEIIAGGLLCCVVSISICRLFKFPFEGTARQTFFNIYCWSFRESPDDQDAAWNVTQKLFNKLQAQTPILQDIDDRVFRFYSDPSSEALASIGRATEALRYAIDP